jgi:hypothetical protein
VELVRANIDTGSAVDGGGMAAENSLNGPAGGTSGGRLCSWPRVL